MTLSLMKVISLLFGRRIFGVIMLMIAAGTCVQSADTKDLSNRILSAISRTLRAEILVRPGGNAEVKQQEWHRDAVEQGRELLRDYLADKSIERQLEQKSSAIEKSLENKSGGVLIEVRLFDAGDGFLEPNVITRGYGLTPVEAVDQSLSEPSLYAADPPNALFDISKSYMKWGVITNGKVQFSDLPPGVLVSGSAEAIHNAAAHVAEQRQQSAQAEFGRKAIAEAAAKAKANPSGTGSPAPPASRPNSGPHGGSPAGDLPHGGAGGMGGGGMGGGGNGGGGGRIDFHTPIDFHGHPSGNLMALRIESSTSSSRRRSHAKLVNDSIDWGLEGTRVWADFDGDGINDFCRFLGSGTRASSFIACTLATGRDIAHLYDGGTYKANITSWGQSGAWVDVNGDHAADYCRVLPSHTNTHRGSLACTLSQGKAKGFGVTITSPKGRLIDLGEPSGRAWIDFNKDGRADFCSLSQTKSGTQNLVCWLSEGDHFADKPLISGEVHWSRTPSHRVWIDVNFDGKTDFCTIAGGNDEFIECTLSEGNKFGQTVRDLIKH